ncbi:hypothetical protein [Adonisia turfae]|uniref:DUF4129 domain-containing protein n=1 Tax=Adonisia turfae CCMR0081 TaxID=2292702 RepID=A0A6M0RE88_9CYAN|nr:hypothetical protein [Adonisia turfae]NEZ54588.1 hypothetical protein [Adonisia turfae CCMR0081]
MQFHVASLCSLALCLWGFQTELWGLAVPMIVCIEGRRVFSKGWTLSKKATVWVLFICISVIVVTLQLTGAFQGMLQLLPLALFPLMLAQLYTTNLSQRMQDFLVNPSFTKRGIQWKRPPFDFGYVYFGLYLLSASAVNANRFLFYSLAWLLVAILFFTLRPAKPKVMAWLGLICLAGILGIWAHRQLSQFQFDHTSLNNGNGQGNGQGYGQGNGQGYGQGDGFSQGLNQDSPLELMLRRLGEKLLASIQEQLPQDTKSRVLLLLIFLGIVTIGGLLIWWWRRRRQKMLAKNVVFGMRSQPTLPGIDSEFYQIEQIFKQLKLRRRPAENLQHWMERLTEKLSVAQVEALKPIIQLHYRYRFDPEGIDAAERNQLRSLSQSWLDSYRVSQDAQG